MEKQLPTTKLSSRPGALRVTSFLRHKLLFKAKSHLTRSNESRSKQGSSRAENYLKEVDLNHLKQFQWNSWNGTALR